MTVGEQILWGAYKEVMKERHSMRMMYPKNYGDLQRLADRADSILEEIRTLHEGQKRKLQEAS